MGKIRNYFLWAACFFILSGTVSGQTVMLKSGQKVEGKIVEQTDKFVKMEFEGVGLIFYNEEIASIEQTPLASDLGASSGQMEKFYQGFLAARNAPEQAPEEIEPAKAVAKEDEQKQDRQVKPPEAKVESIVDEEAQTQEEKYLAQVPLEFRDKLKEDLAKMRGEKPALVEGKRKLP